MVLFILYIETCFTSFVCSCIGDLRDLLKLKHLINASVSSSSVFPVCAAPSKVGGLTVAELLVAMAIQVINK